jgi:hypothetical protein
MVMKAAAILGVAVSLAVSGMAQAAGLPSRQEPICHAGILADAVTGRPVLGPNREPVPCGAPVVEGGIDTLYVVGGLAAVGLGVGLAVGLSGGGCTNKLVPISGGAIPICN